MSDSRFISSPVAQRARWLVVPAALFTVGGAILLWRRRPSETTLSSMPDAPDAVSVRAAPVAVESKPCKPQSPVRWLLYLGAALFCGGLLVVLETTSPELSTAIFTLLLLAAACYAVYRLATLILRQILTVRTVLMHLWQLVKQSADVVSLIMVGVVFYCLTGSALLFKDSLTFLPLFGQAGFLFVISFFAVGLVFVLKPQAILVGRWRGKVNEPAERTQPFNLWHAFGGLIAAMSGTGLLFLLAEINFNALNSSLLQNVHHVVQFVFLILGVILLVVGLGGRVRLPVMTRREVFCLSALMGLALVLRCVALDTVIHRYVDEVNFMEAIPRLWAKPDTPILIPFGDLTAFTWVYPILQSAISNIVGSSLFGLRLISAILGTLGVVALYFLVRTLFHNKWLALAAALILATFPAHLHFSRLGLNNIADPLFGTLALAFLMRGLQSHYRSDYVIAGGALGLTQYFYEGGRLFFPPLLIVVFILSWLLSGHRKTDLIHAGYTLLVALLIAAPIYYTLIGTHNLLTPRLNNEALGGDLWSLLFGGDQPLADWLRGRFLYPLLMYTSISDQSWFYGGQQALVILPLVPFFLLGIAYALWKLFSPAIIILFLWIIMTALGNSVLRDNLWIPRYVVAFPALAVFMALGVYTTSALLWPSSKPKRWLYVTMAGLSILLATVQTVFYFRDQVPFFLQQFQQEDWNDAFFRMADLPPGTPVHFIMDTPMWDINIQAFLGYNRLNLAVNGLRPDQVTTTYLKKITTDPTIQHVFFINPNKKDMLALLRCYFTLDEPQFGSENIPLQFQLGLYKAHVLSQRIKVCRFPNIDTPMKRNRAGFTRKPIR